MAGVELNVVSTANMAKPVSSNAPTRETIRRTPEIKTADTVKVQKQDEAEKPKLNKKEESLENVVARSEYGDTVQVSEDGANELEESRQGAVVAEEGEASYLANEKDNEENFSIERPEIAEIEKPEIVLPEVKTPEVELLGSQEVEVEGPPFNEYSSGQMEAFYQDGDISEYTYDTEISRRKALHDEIMEENSAFTNKMSEVTASAARAEQADFAIDAALDSESKFDIKDRMTAVNGKDGSSKASVAIDEDRKIAARVTEEEGKLWDYQLRA